MTPKLKTANKYKGDRRKILLNLYYQKHLREAQLYKKYKFKKLHFVLLAMWDNYREIPTPLIEAVQLKRFITKYTEGFFSYTVPYNISK